MDDVLDDGSQPATADDLRGVLRKHRRRQLTVLAAVLAAVLVAGAGGGFLAGRQGRTAATNLASAPSTGAADSKSSPAKLAPIVPMTTGGGAETQLLIRDTGGIRVRLYGQTYPTPPATCGVNVSCAAPTTAACLPVGVVEAEVSDEQVAGAVTFPQWQTTTGAVTVLGTDMVGRGEPQPILVTVGHVASNVVQVTLDAGSQQDAAAPTKDGWVALALPLASGATALPDGSLKAVDASGHAVYTNSWSGGPDSTGGGNGQVPCVPPGVVCGSASAGSGSASVSGSASGSGSVSSGGATVETAPAPASPPNAPAVPPPSPSDVTTCQSGGGCSTTFNGAPVTAGGGNVSTMPCEVPPMPPGAPAPAPTTTVASAGK